MLVVVPATWVWETADPCGIEGSKESSGMSLLAAEEKVMLCREEEERGSRACC